jgi:GDP-L-fucose synthase
MSEGIRCWAHRPFRFFSHKGVPSGVEVVTVARSEVDLCNAYAVSTFLAQSRPDAIIVAAARVGGIGANFEFELSFLLENLQIPCRLA